MNANSSENGSRIALGPADQIPEGEGRPFEINGKTVAVFNIGGSFFALDSHCPHRGAPLHEGAVDGMTVLCPWHAWEFDAKSGLCLTDDAFCQKTYQVIQEGTDLFLIL